MKWKRHPNTQTIKMGAPYVEGQRQPLTPSHSLSPSLSLSLSLPLSLSPPLSLALSLSLTSLSKSSDTSSPALMRNIALSNSEGKLFFAVVAHRIQQHMVKNKYFDGVT
jgi:hypothetical protein